MRPEEPQSHRDLALALSDRADALADAAAATPAATAARIASDYGRSLDLLNQVIVRPVGPVPGDRVALPDGGQPRICPAERMQRRADLGDVPVPLDARLRKNLDCDVRVVMTWDADSTDVDLWVTEPSGEKCFYGHNRTVDRRPALPRLHRRLRPRGVLPAHLMPGKYAVQANFYGSRQQELTGPPTVQATVFTDFGRPNEKRQSLTLRLADAKEVVDIGGTPILVRPSQHDPRRVRGSHEHPRHESLCPAKHLLSLSCSRGVNFSRSKQMSAFKETAKSAGRLVRHALGAALSPVRQEAENSPREIRRWTGRQPWTCHRTHFAPVSQFPRGVRPRMAVRTFLRR